MAESIYKEKLAAYVADKNGVSKPTPMEEYRLYSVSEMFDILNVPNIELLTNYGKFIEGTFIYNGVEYIVEMISNTVKFISDYLQEQKIEGEFSFYCYSN